VRDYIISGIQQIGVGVPDLHAAFKWSARTLGMDIPAFEDEGVADLMLRYTGGEPRERKAILAVNLQGGGGLELWQYKKRSPQRPEFIVQAGDLGIGWVRIKSRDVAEAFKRLSSGGAGGVGSLSEDPSGSSTFFVRDPFGSLFQIVEGDAWFASTAAATGGVCGCAIGVSDTERSVRFYGELLGYDFVIYDKTGVFSDLDWVHGGANPVRRVLLGHSEGRKGPFSELLGPSQIELVQALDRHPRKIFADRYWGDMGFIHLCFDVRGIDALKEKMAKAGSRFTVDSGDAFSMGASAGRFAYVEDPDGTLIEMVETFKLGLLKKLGLFLDLRHRSPEKPLPRFLLRAMGLNRVRFRE